MYLANPNNPTGTLLERGEVRGFLDALPEACCACSTRPTPSTPTEPEGPALLREGRARLCVLRTFSKVYGLAALRIGYALASPEVADALDRVRPIFNVNQPAQEAALASLGEARRGGGARGRTPARARELLHDALAGGRARPDPVAGELRVRGRARAATARGSRTPAARGGASSCAR